MAVFFCVKYIFIKKRRHMAKRIKLTQSYLKRMVNEAIDEFKNASTERFNTDPTYRNMIDVNGIEDEDEFLNAVHNHQFNPNYARENGYDDVADKWEEREKKYPEGFVRDQFGNWIDDGGDYMDESRRKNKVRLTESQLHRIIKESVKKVLKENYGSLGTYYEQLKSYLLHRKDCIQQHHQNGVDTFQIKEDLVLHGRKCKSVYFCVDNAKHEEYIAVEGYGIIEDDQTCALVLYDLKNHEAMAKDGYSSYTLH